VFWCSVVAWEKKIIMDRGVSGIVSDTVNYDNVIEEDMGEIDY